MSHVTPPPTMATVDLRLLAKDGHGIHTFSNGTEWECWASGNCLSCRYWNPDQAGTWCAFECAAFLDQVSPELARMFGWEQAETKYGPRFGWRSPDQCPFFCERPENDDGSWEPPPPPDPDQLVLLADPTEDAALFAVAPREMAISVPSTSRGL